MSAVTAAPTRHRWVRLTALAAGMLVVFAFHFRPWEVGYMEEWPLAADWAGAGGAFTADYLSWTLSRPLHLLPTLLGLFLAGGAPGGIFLVLGVVAALQLPAVIWALRPVSNSFWVSGAVGIFLALHPLWAGGFLQRFLPAQTAVLALALSLGMLIRWLRDGRLWWLLGCCATLLTGFLVYPGPTAVAPIMGMVVVLALRTPRTRAFVSVAAVVGTSVLMTVYSLVVARFLSPSGTSYELNNIEVAAVSGPREFFQLFSSTILDRGIFIVLAIVAVCALAATLGLLGAIPHPSDWLMAGSAAISPVVTVVYFGHVGWLQDMDRLAYVMSLAIFVALIVWPMTATTHRVTVQRVIAGVLVVTALVGGALGVAHWQRDIALQHQLLDEIGPAVRAAGDDQVVVVVDRSGTYGLMQTFPLQYLASASSVWHNDSTMVWLCFDDPSAVPSGGVACETDFSEGDLDLVNSFPLATGTVDVYLAPKESDD